MFSTTVRDLDIPAVAFPTDLYSFLKFNTTILRDLQKKLIPLGDSHTRNLEMNKLSITG